jgi:cyclase
MNRFVVLGALLIAGALSMAAAAYQQPSQGLPAPALAATKIEKVKDNLYIITGSSPTPRETFSGGNTGVFVTDKGVVVVDTKLAGWGPTLLERIKSVTDKPVTTIINTHTHPDHIGSNDYFPASVDVVTHENTRKWMAANPRVASNAAMMPDRTFTDRMTLGSGDDRIDLYYFGAGHTNGDAFIVFPARRAMCAGDMFAWKMAPLIDPMAGGSVLALPDSLENAVKGIPNVDTVIEGHGDVNTWQGFRDYVQFNRALLDAAKAGMGQKTAEEIAAGLKPKFPVFTKEELLTDMEYGGTPLSRAVINVNVAFQELGKR